MKNALHRVQIDSGFLAYWTLANAFGFAVGELVVVPFGGMVYVFGSLVLKNSAIKSVSETLAQALAVAPVGICLGFSQWLALRNRLKNAEWWLVATLIGWILAGVILWEFGSIGLASDVGVIGFVGAPTEWVVAGAIMGVAAGLVQMLILPLQRYTKFLWPILNGLGWAVGLALGILFVKDADVFFGPIIGAAFSGIFTGIFLHLLFIGSDENTGQFISTLH